jgi:alkylhydroperoxidase/carboxymuconolactone decarboxylase family protein YurZ
VEELKELFLHSAIYCGLPAANAAYHCAGEVLKELDVPLPAREKGS